jgi:hypothetical protein
MTQTNYTPEIADTTCSKMSEGFSLRAVCREPGLPSEGTVRGRAVRNVDAFGERYRAARLLLLDYWADEIVNIADNAEFDPSDRQIRIAVRQWIMSEVSCHYNDKLQIGGDPENAFRVMHEQVPLKDLSAEQLAALERSAQVMIVVKAE